LLTDEEATRLEGATLVSADGQELGEVESLLTHSADNRAAWALVTVSGRRTLVPLDTAEDDGGTLRVRYEAELITSAPEHGDDELTAESAQSLYDHYGIDDSTLRDDSGYPTEEGQSEPGAGGDPRSGGADDAAQGHP
jgi:PRC-barrel domain